MLRAFDLLNVFDIFKLLLQRVHLRFGLVFDISDEKDEADDDGDLDDDADIAANQTRNGHTFPLDRSRAIFDFTQREMPADHGS